MFAALNTLRAVVDPEAVDGDYYGPDGLANLRGYPTKVAVSSVAASDDLAQWLWQTSIEKTGVNPDDVIAALPTKY